MPPKRNPRRRNNNNRTRAAPTIVTLRRHELLGNFPKGGSVDQSHSGLVLPITPNILSTKTNCALYAEYRFTYLKLFTSPSRPDIAGLHYIAFSTQPTKPPTGMMQAAQHTGFVSGSYARPLQSKLKLNKPDWYRMDGNTPPTTEPHAWAILGSYDTAYDQCGAQLYLSYTVQFRNPRPNITAGVDVISTYAQTSETISINHE